jgi:hypothetical protein
MTQLLLSLTTDTYKKIEESRSSVVVAVVKAIRILTGLDLREAKTVWDEMNLGKSVTITIIDNLSTETYNNMYAELKSYSLRITNPLTPTEQAIVILKEQSKLLIDADRFDVAGVLLEAIEKIADCERHNSGMIPIPSAR